MDNMAGAMATARYDASGASGVFSLPGRVPEAFVAFPAKAKAGFYVAGLMTKAGPYAGRWVVMPNGTKRRGAAPGRDHHRQPANRHPYQHRRQRPPPRADHGGRRLCNQPRTPVEPRLTDEPRLPRRAPSRAGGPMWPLLGGF